MVQGKKPDGPGGDPSIVIIKLKRPAYHNWLPGGFGAVELPAGALPVPHPGVYFKACTWKYNTYLTQDVQGGRNGSDAPVGEHQSFLLTDHFILRRQMVEQQMATERLARKFRASLGTTVRSGRGWMEPHSLFDLFICLTIPFFLQPGGVRCNYGPEGSGWRLPSEHKQIHLFL